MSQADLTARMMELERIIDEAREELISLNPRKPFLVQLREELVRKDTAAKKEEAADIIELGELLSTGLNMMMVKVQTLTESYGEIRLTTPVGALCYDSDNCEWYFVEQR